MGVTKDACAVTLALVLAVASGETVLAAGAGPSESFDEDAALREAKELIVEGRFEDALAELEELIAENDANADAWNLVGFSYRKLGKYDLSLDGYSRALAIDPRHTEAIEYLGELYLALDDLEQAERQLAKLRDICGSGCEEFDELKEAVARYKAAKGG